MMENRQIGKLIVASVALAVVAFGGKGRLVLQTGAAQEPRSGQAAAAGTAQQNDAVEQLKKQLLEAARKTYELELSRFRNLQVGDMEQVSRWSRRWLEAQLALAADRDARLTAYRAHLERMRGLQKVASALGKAGQATPSYVTAAEYGRVQAELWLEQAKAKTDAR